jgi:class 3 adenylate cyclase/pimeloyl-ACP methyl ester carboxylesterase
MGSEARYARADDGVRIAYQRFGEGSVDLVYLPYFLFNIDLFWDFEPLARWLSGLAEFARVIVHDPRGTGLSDREAEPGDLARRVDDVLAVLDDAGVGSAALFGSLSVGAVGAFMGASHPDRISALVWLHASAREAWAPDYPWGRSADEFELEIGEAESRWGSSEDGQAHAASQGPMGQVDADFQRWMAKMLRSSVTPARAESLLRAWYATDVRDILPQLGTPTLVLARESTVDESRAVASMIPGASFVQLPGLDHMPWFGDTAAVLDATRSFLGVEKRSPDAERFLATVLFTDIVGSTSRAASVGDERWRQIVGEHHRLIRGLLDRHHGTEMDTAGDGFYATFGSPSDGARCALDAASAVAAIGVEIRAGLHTGEVQRVDRKLGGLATAIGARICSLASASQVLVSSTVKDLTAGSGLVFEDAGEHELKGVPGRWHLYRVAR